MSQHTNRVVKLDQNFRMKPSERITGKLKATAHRDKDGNITSVTYELEGGDVIGVTAELMNNLDERWVKREGDTLVFGPHAAKILEHIVEPSGFDWYLVWVKN